MSLILHTVIIAVIIIIQIIFTSSSPIATQFALSLASVPQSPMPVAHNSCPICQAMQGLEDIGEWHWGFDDGGNPLIAEYDPEGWDAFWSKDVEEAGSSERDQGGLGPDEWNTDKTDFSVN